MKTDLKDTTFLIPIRVDSMVRLENLILTLECISDSFSTTIVVLEAAAYDNGIIRSLFQDKINYRFYEDKDPIFYKTKYLNRMAETVTTPLVAIWDVDVILEPGQIMDAVQHLRDNRCDIAYPYNGDFFDTSDILRNHYMIHRDIEYLKRNTAKMNSLYTVEGVIGAVGGAIFCKTEKYLYAGMENESFYGWGLEDGERHYRWLSFGYTIHRSPGCLFHLSHPRDLNGMFRSSVHQSKAYHDMNEIVNYTQKELRDTFSSIKTDRI